MARRKTKPRPLTLKAMMTLEPELDGVCRQLAALAMAQLEQESPLGVRQTEQLRRALTTAGDALGWTATAAYSDDSIADVSKDFMTMAKGVANGMPLGVTIATPEVADAFKALTISTISNSKAARLRATKVQVNGAA